MRFLILNTDYPELLTWLYSQHAGLQKPPYEEQMRARVDSLLGVADIFEPGKEVVAYRSPEECTELIRYYLEHEDERAAIARAGQQRTLYEHTYYHRMQELVDILRRYL